MVKKASTSSSSEKTQSDGSKISSESNQKISNNNGSIKKEPVRLDVKPESKSLEFELPNNSSVTLSVEETLEQGMVPSIFYLTRFIYFESNNSPTVIFIFSKLRYPEKKTNISRGRIQLVVLYQFHTSLN